MNISNPSPLLQEGDKDEQIKALKEALAEKSEEIKRLQVKADKWDALGEKIAKYYPEDGENFDDSDGLIGIGERAAQAFGYL